MTWESERGQDLQEGYDINKFCPVVQDFDAENKSISRRKVDSLLLRGTLKNGL